MAYQNREQVGSSFKPYILAAAVKEGMNVKTSTLDGYNNLYIPPDSQPNAYSTAPRSPESHAVSNDDPGENGPYTPQVAMAESINTAYADLWHKVAGRAATPRSTTSARWRSCSAWTPTRPASPARTTSRTSTASRSAWRR